MGTHLSNMEISDEGFRVRFHCVGFPSIPDGVPKSEDGLPLYPDPNLYSPDIIAGYNGWIELTPKTKGFTYCWINPGDSRFLQAPTIRVGDTVNQVHSLLGLASRVEEVPGEGLRAEFYSQEVMILYGTDDDKVRGVHTHKPPANHYKMWEFVFVAPDSP